MTAVKPLIHRFDRVGHVQRQILFELAGGAETTSSLQMALPSSTYSDIYGACSRLWKRGLVERSFSYGKIEWYLTWQGHKTVDVLIQATPDEDVTP